MNGTTESESFPEGREHVVQIPLGNSTTECSLYLPPRSQGWVLFAHGSGSSRFSPRNQYVAQRLNDRGVGTALVDLLTPAEEYEDERFGHLRFNIGFLSERLAMVLGRLRQLPVLGELPVGLFGASTGAAAALKLAATLPDTVSAVVCRGGRPDLAEAFLDRVSCPTLFIVGGEDHLVLRLNREALERVRGPKRLHVVEGAGHLFQEPGALKEVAAHAAIWFQQHLAHPTARRRGTAESAKA